MKGYPVTYVGDPQWSKSGGSSCLRSRRGRPVARTEPDT